MAVPTRYRAQAAVTALLACAAALLLAGCAGGPVAPAWQSDAHYALASYEQAYLRGNDRLAQLEFAQARREISSTGRGALLARAELLRCALRVASLAFDDCPGYRALARDADAPERAYAAYLSGRGAGFDVALLPAPQRAVAAGGGERALDAIADPVSRLVAAGVLFRGARITPRGIATAVRTASAQGWRRPLLAWLGVEAQRAEAGGDAAAAARIRRRIDLVVSGGKAP